MHEQSKVRFTVMGKILSIVVAGISLVTLSVGFGVFELSKISDDFEFIADAEIPLSAAVSQVTAHRLEQSVLTERFLRLNDTTSKPNSPELIEIRSNIETLGAKIGEELLKAEEAAENATSLATSEELNAKFSSILETIRAVADEHSVYSHVTTSALAKASLGERGIAEAQFARVEAKHSALNSQLETLLFEIQDITLDATTTAVEREQDALRLTLLLTIGSVLLSLTLVSWSGRTVIVTPLRKVAEALYSLSRNDLNAELGFSQNDEIGDIGQAFHVFKKRLIDARQREKDEKDRQLKLTREIRLLSELNEWLQSSSNLNELFDMVSQFMIKLLPNTAGSLYVYSNSRDVLDGACSWNGGALEAHIRPDACWGLRRGRPYVFGENEVNFRCEHVAPQDEDRASICLPILANGETVGLMHLNAVEGVELEEFLKNRKLAQMSAEQISMAISNTRMRDELHNQSIRDPLTGLFNRRHFVESLRSKIEKARHKGHSLSLISIDVDHFKTFNDNNGHDAGDMVLRAVGTALEQQFEGDDLPCRIGGEEFMVLLPDATSEEAMERAEALRQVIEKITVRYGEKNLPKITISSGVASCPDHGMMPQDLIKVADDALYRSKDSGRNQVTMAQTGEVAASTPETAVKDLMALKSQLEDEARHSDTKQDAA
ncbi:diguanylate cyclase [Roseibium sp. TrichSKD4]|uniref:diguanylate cyclase n=1 Tax=Roseibium sp. TrichSKD4 TaxID=744980 RepID=UPI000682253B|nr:diguanylate cyclase [Roseibium sp. TrichSKD4]